MATETDIPMLSFASHQGGCKSPVSSYSLEEGLVKRKEKMSHQEVSGDNHSVNRKGIERGKGRKPKNYVIKKKWKRRVKMYVPRFIEVKEI